MEIGDEESGRGVKSSKVRENRTAKIMPETQRTLRLRREEESSEAVAAPGREAWCARMKRLC
jgi:hypothetical protein